MKLDGLQRKPKKQPFMLDVGCGHLYEGDVNIDLFIEATAHRSLEANMRTNTDIKLSGVPNLIQADCGSTSFRFLPIKDSVFDVAVSNHLVEHIDEPFKLLKEMVRVTKPDGLIRVTTPHKLSHNRKWIMHKHSFNLAWFLKAFRVLSVELVGSKKSYKYIPHDYFPLFRVPYFIQVLGRVKK